MIRFVLIALFALGLFTSCSRKVADQNWAEGKWVLTELKEVPVQISGHFEKDAHLEFRPSTRSYGGFGGCNRIAGTYTLNGSKIKFTPSAAKLAGCPDVPFETTFLSLLSEVDKYEINGNTMVLKDGSKRVIKLERK